MPPQSQFSGVEVDYYKEIPAFYARLYERSSRSGPSLEEKLMVSLQDQVVTRKPKYVIVDLRLNTGGNFMKTILFTQVFGVTDVSLEPDVEVATSFADYAAGRDAVLTAALERARDLQ